MKINDKIQSNEPTYHNKFVPPIKVKAWKYKLALWRRYFDTGLTLTSYLKYLVALFGIATLNLKDTMVLGIIYGIGCFVVGWAWFKYGWMTIDLEIGNQFNVFVGEMRDFKKDLDK